MEDTICAVSTAPEPGGLRHPHLRTGSNRNLQHDIRTAYSRKRPAVTESYTLRYGSIRRGEELIDEVLIALSMSAATDSTAKKALSQLPKLRGCQVHTSVMLSSVDIKLFKKTRYPAHL